MAHTLQSTITLSNEVEMPQFGLGVFETREGRQVRNAVRWALEAGYRSIDTAAVYDNEAGVGRAIRDSGLPREELFVTTKVWNSSQRSGHTLQAFEASLRKLQMDYVDLYLVHWPVAGYFKQTWRDLETVYGSGRARAIGVSNFMVEHLRELLPETRITPMVNQIEFHPYLQSPELVALCQEMGIQVEAWAPIMKGRVLKIEELRDLGNKYGKNAVQISLRWLLQRGIVAIPKSTKQQRIIDNAEIFDFELTAEEIAMINSLDRGQRVGPSPYNFSF